MKVKRDSVLYAIICALIAMVSCNLTANNLPDALTTREAATAEILHLLHEYSANHHIPNHPTTNPLIVPVTFENDIEGLILLKLDHKPEFARKFVDHFSFTINGQEVPPNEKKVIPLRKDKPFKFSIIAKRGKIASLVTLAKSLVSDIKQSFTDQIKNMCLNALNIISLHCTYDCPYEEQGSRNNVKYMAELIYERDDFKELMDDIKKLIKEPNSETLGKVTKDRIGWPSWFDISFKLPQLKKNEEFN